MDLFARSNWPAAWRSTRRDVAALGVILLAVLILFKDAVFSGWVFFEFDTGIYYYPLAKWLASSLAEGQIPLWSPYIYGGFPLFADGEGAVFYPPNLALLRALGAEQGFIWLAVLHFFMAGAFTYAFVRLLQPGRLPALIAGLTFALGSFMVTQMHHVNVVDSAAWLPLILFWLELALRSSGRRQLTYTALGGTSFGLQLLTMHIQPVLMTLLCAGLYVLFRLTVGGEFGFYRLVRGIAVGAAVVIIGLALSGVQLLPLRDLAAQAARGDGATYQFGSSFAIAPPSLVTMLFPYFFRIGGYEYWSLWFRWEITLYAGIAPICLALVAVLLKRSRVAMFFACIGLLGVLLAMGDHSPINIYSVWWHLPGFDFLRAPGRFTFLVTFSIALLAGLGASHLQALLGQEGAPRRALRRLLLGLLIAGFFLLSTMTIARNWLVANRDAAIELIERAYLGLRRQTDLHLDANEIYPALRDTLAWQNPRTVLTFVFLLATVLTIFAWLRWPQGRSLWQCLLASVVVIDLLSFGMIYHPQTPIAKIDRNVEGAPEFLALHRGLHRIYNQQPMGLMSPNRLLPLEVATVGGYSSLVGKRYAGYMRAVRQGKSNLLDLWNVRYVLTPKKGAPPGPPERYRPVFEDRDNVVYENARYLPRAFVVKDAVVVGSGKTALQTIEQPGFDPRRLVVLEREGSGDEDKAEPIPPLQPAAGAGNRGFAGRARITQYDANQVTIEMNVASDGYLVLSDSFDAGWQATLDGQPSAIYRADYLFRAIPVARGQHTAVFSYDPSSLKAGALISGTTLFGLIVGLASLYIRPLRRAHHRRVHRLALEGDL